MPIRKALFTVLVVLSLFPYAAIGTGEETGSVAPTPHVGTYLGIPEPLLFPLVTLFSAFAILGAAVISGRMVIRSARQSAEAIQEAAQQSSAATRDAAVISANAARDIHLEFERAQEDKERCRFASALRGEIKATVQMTQRHKYRDIYADALEQLKASVLPGYAITMPAISTETDPRRSVFYSNLEKIGLLPEPLPEKLSTLYILTYSLQIDMRDMDSGKWNHCTGAVQKDFLQHFLDTHDDTIELVEEVLGYLDDIIGEG